MIAGVSLHIHRGPVMVSEETLRKVADDAAFTLSVELSMLLSGWRVMAACVKDDWATLTLTDANDDGEMTMKFRTKIDTSVDDIERMVGGKKLLAVAATVHDVAWGFQLVFTDRTAVDLKPSNPITDGKPDLEIAWDGGSFTVGSGFGWQHHQSEWYE